MFGTLIKKISKLDPAHGDITIKWNSENEREVNLAKKLYDTSLAEGFWAYKVEAGKGRTLLKEWNPDVEEIIMLPKQTGG